MHTGCNNDKVCSNHFLMHHWGTVKRVFILFKIQVNVVKQGHYLIAAYASCNGYYPYVERLTCGGGELVGNGESK